MVKGNKQEFQKLADFILHDYLGNLYDTPTPVDIFAFASDYLKMTVSYMSFPADKYIEGIRFADRIYIDEGLSKPECKGARNFTVAHECAHELINWQDENYNPGQFVNHRTMTARKQLVTEYDFAEWQANTVGAHLLMRPDLVGWCMFTFAHKEKLTIYGNSSYPNMYYDDAMAITNMAGYMGVSKSALRYRLKELDMLEERPITEYDYAIAHFQKMRRW